jgi:hypothetical protein
MFAQLRKSAMVESPELILIDGISGAFSSQFLADAIGKWPNRDQFIYRFILNAKEDYSWQFPTRPAALNEPRAGFPELCRIRLTS